MRRVWRETSFVLILALFSRVLIAGTSAGLSSNGSLIQDVDRLRDSLPPGDSSRPALTLRLADLLFEDATDLEKDPARDAATDRTITKYRERAARLYREVLAGEPGVSAPANGTQRTKILFQLARISTDLGRPAEADPLWKNVLNQTQLPELRREAALRLAEVAEKEKSPARLADADRLYQIAIELCGGGEICAYAHHRRSWILRSQERYPEAIQEIELALWDSKGQIREECLKDYILFLASEPTDGKKALQLIQPMSEKLVRPQLLVTLAEAFYSAGNKIAGTYVLAYVDSRSPNIRYEARLLEEYYGLRQWDPFHEVYERAESGLSRAVAGGTPAKADAETEKILRRLTIQLDGERITQPRYARDFQDVTLLYLRLFPTSSVHFKMMEGWIAAEEKPERKLAQLKSWEEDGSLALTAPEKLRLHEMRAGVAQKSKDYVTVAEETSTLSTLTTSNATKAREYRFLSANALLAQKNQAAALPILKDLARPSTQPDSWAEKSEKMAVGILADNKDYSGVIEQADSWLGSASLRDNQVVSKTLGELKQIRDQATFERAVGQGNTPPALQVFRDFCEKKILLPKSCENARVLAGKIGDQASLLAVLKAQGKKDELASEYERSGHFVSAAELLEHSLSDTKSYLKVALLYELGGNNGSRDRILTQLAARLRSGRKLGAGAEEELVFQTFRDAGLLGPGFLDLGWSAPVQAKLAYQLELRGKGSERTRRILLDSSENLGPLRSEHILDDIKGLQLTESKIGFYGKQSRRNFERRIAALKRLEQTAERYLPSVDAPNQARILEVLTTSHKEFADQILASPIPATLDASAVEQVKASLAGMAEPFQKRAQNYEKLAQEAQAKASSTVALAQGVQKGGPKGDQKGGQKGGMTSESGVSESGNESSSLAPLIEALHMRPNAPEILSGIKTYYERAGQLRLASYFEGRLRQIKKEEG